MLRAVQEEILHTATHGVGLILSVVGSAYLLHAAYETGDNWRIAGCLVFSASLICVYLFSTLSHAVWHPPSNRLFRILDQAFIFLLIVGTYTPFGLAFLRTTGWLTFLGLLWVIALAGFIAKLAFAHRVDAISVWLHLVLGWAPIFATFALLEHVTSTPLLWLLAGGLFYTGGTVFLILDWRDYHFHAIWHLMVIAGSVCHYISILCFVALLS